MHSFLITMGDDASRLKKARNICLELQIDLLDQKLYGDKEGNEETKNVDEKTGIKLIRTIQQSLILKPYMSPSKAVIIANADQLSIAAQNALLKILEEPPPHTILILLAGRKDAMLPTIHSRCTLLRVDEEISQITEKETEKFANLLQDIQEGTSEKKFLLTEQLLKEADLLIFLTKLTKYLQQKMLTSVAKEEKEAIRLYERILQKILMAQNILTSTNTNPKLTIEHLIFSF